jgi:hypothetical protein
MSCSYALFSKEIGIGAYGGKAFMFSSFFFSLGDLVWVLLVCVLSIVSRVWCVGGLCSSESCISVGILSVMRDEALLNVNGPTAQR